MDGAIRTTVTVQRGGVIEITSPELKEGDRAEVIVLVPASASVADKIAALEELRERLNLDEEKVRKWIEVVRTERESFGPRE